MGARALTADEHPRLSVEKMPLSVVEELLGGACEKLQEANVLLVGGHSMEFSDLFYGMSVTGTIHPDRVLTNAKAADRRSTCSHETARHSRLQRGASERWIDGG